MARTASLLLQWCRFDGRDRSSPRQPRCFSALAEWDAAVPGTTEVWSRVRRFPKKLAAQALVILILVGVTSAFTRLSKAVALSVDGQTRPVHTVARTVGELLYRQNIRPGVNDSVAPDPDTPLADGAVIAVRYGRQLTLDFNGQTRQVWVTATSVEEALQQLGVRAERAQLSVSRSALIGRQGLALTIRIPREVTLLVDGQRHVITTMAATVRQALAEAQLRLGPSDQVSAPLDSFPDEVIRIVRNGTLVTEQLEIPHPVKKIADTALAEGEKKVLTKGEDGLKVVTYREILASGTTKIRKLIRSRVIREPITEIIKVNPKDLRDSLDDLNWGALARCESGGRPDAVSANGLYVGAFQFNGPTWHGAGGYRANPDKDPYAKASDAPYEEQLARAKVLYKDRGIKPWPHCGPLLHKK